MLRYLALGAAFLTVPATADELPLSACPAPVYSAEALRYLMEGEVRLELALQDDGHVGTVAVRQSSGYQLLDRASVALAEKCAFHAPPGLHTLAVPWRLPADAAVDTPARPAQGQCKSNFKLFEFVDLANPARNISVRTQVWQDGQAFTAKIEQSSDNPEADKIAISIVEHCHFEPAVRNGEPVRGAALVGLAFDRDGISDASVTARYDKLAKSIAAQREYHVAHILVKTEREARDILAELASGEDFAALAKARSIDAGSAKQGGLLPWMTASRYVRSVAAAITAQDVPGLVRKPIKSEFGWHVIQVVESRPATVAPLNENLKKLIRDMLLKEASPSL